MTSESDDSIGWHHVAAASVILALVAVTLPVIGQAPPEPDLAAEQQADNNELCAAVLGDGATWIDDGDGTFDCRRADGTVVERVDVSQAFGPALPSTEMLLLVGVASAVLVVVRWYQRHKPERSGSYRRDPGG